MTEKEARQLVRLYRSQHLEDGRHSHDLHVKAEAVRVSRLIEDKIVAEMIRRST